MCMHVFALACRPHAALTRQRAKHQVAAFLNRSPRGIGRISRKKQIHVCHPPFRHTDLHNDNLSYIKAARTTQQIRYTQGNKGISLVEGTFPSIQYMGIQKLHLILEQANIWCRRLSFFF